MRVKVCQTCQTFQKQKSRVFGPAFVQENQECLLGACGAGLFHPFCRAE
jgi:hypothetical protein